MVGSVFVFCNAVLEANDRMIRNSLIAGMRLEWSLAIRDPIFPLTIAIIGMLTLLAVYTGWLRNTQVVEVQRSFRQDNAQQRLYLESAFEESHLMQMTNDDAALSDRQFELQMSARSPDLMRHTAGIWWTLYPTSPLSAFSAGASNDWPNYYYHRGYSAVQTLTRTVRPNPLLAVVGAFDLTLLVGTILPLAVIALTYNIVSSDRAHGRWSLVVLHAPSKPRLIATRCFVRMIALSITVISVTACFVLIASTDVSDFATIRNFMIWSGMLLVYLTFWSVLVIAVNSLPFSSSGAGLFLLLCWSILVIAVPAAVEHGVNQRFQILPQTELLKMEREIRREVETETEKVWADFLSRYPTVELAPNNPQQEHLLRDLAVSKETYSRIQERLHVYYQQFLDRDFTIDQSQILTPLLAWKTAADQSAGTSLRHYLEFAQQTSKFHRDYTEFFERFSLEGRELTQSDVQKIPHFDGHQIEHRLFAMPLLMSAGSLFFWTTLVTLLNWWLVRCRPVV